MFVYVFSEQDKTKLLSNGYALLKEDPKNNLYVFALELETDALEEFSTRFDLGKYCFTNVLTF